MALPDKVAPAVENAAEAARQSLHQVADRLPDADELTERAEELWTGAQDAAQDAADEAAEAAALVARKVREEPVWSKVGAALLVLTVVGAVVVIARRRKRAKAEEKAWADATAYTPTAAD